MLNVEKHIRYFYLCLQLFPAQVQSEDSNKLALSFFVLLGLDFVGALERQTHQIHYIYQHLIPLKGMQAFRALQTFALDEAQNAYDLPSLHATFFALASLVLLGEDYSRTLDRHRIMAFVRKCQILDGEKAGSFRPVLDNEGKAFGESDLRLCYLAAGVRKLVGYDKLPAAERRYDFDTAKLESFIESQVTISGGFSLSPEAHAGLTFCAIAALRLLGADFGRPWVAKTERWLVLRQIGKGRTKGGFNGRENKPADTCYSWWVGGSLAILGKLPMLDCDHYVEYLLLQTQNTLVGGFSKDGEARPDPMHSYLALASLALAKRRMPIQGGERLAEVDEELVLTRRARDFLEQITSGWGGSLEGREGSH